MQDYVPPSDSAAALVPRCREAPATIAADSIGPLRIGQSLAALIQKCPQVLVGWDWGDEGVPEPALAVGIGPIVVVATPEDTTTGAHVVILSTASPSARTSDGIPIGMPNRIRSVTIRRRTLRPD